LTPQLTHRKFQARKPYDRARHRVLTFESLEPKRLLSAYNWQSVPIGGGGFVTGIIYSPTVPNLVYARTDVGGAYRWDQSVGQWTPLFDFLPYNDPVLLAGDGVESMAIDPNNADRVYAAVGIYTWQGQSAIFRSSDRGQTWQRANLPFGMGGNQDGRSDGERLMVDPNNSSILFMGTNQNGLWKSTDYGITWNQVTSFPVATTSDGVGLDFVQFIKSSGTPGSATPTIYVGVSQTGNNLYKSTDGGATWQSVSNPSLDPTQMPEHAALDSDGSMYLTFGNTPGPGGMGTSAGTLDGSVWKLQTSTGAWTNVTPNTNGQGGFSGVSVDAEHPGTLVITTMDRWWPADDIYRSTNGGATWTSLRNTDINPWPQGWTDNIQWDGGSGGMGWPGNIEIDPFNSNHAMVAYGGGIIDTFDLTNADSGLATQWGSFVNNLEEVATTALVSPPSGAPLITAAGDVGGYRFADPSAPGTGYNIMSGTNRDIDYAENNPNLMVRCGDDSPYIVYSTDNGVTWSAFASVPSGTSSAGLLAMSADGSRVVWDPGGGVMSYATWNGSAWSAWTTSAWSGSADVNPVSDRVNSNYFYVLDGQKVYASSDGGATWTLKTSSAPYGTLQANYTAEGDLWINAGTSGLWHSTDHGATWTQVASSIVADAATLGFGKAAPGQTYPAIYLGGTANHTTGMFRSDDGGTTWVTISDAQDQLIGTITGDKNVYGRVYIATRGLIVGQIQSTAPSVATAAACTPNPVTGTTANLSVLGADDGGESNLTYTWRVTNHPPTAAAPSFSINGANAAKNTTVTFSQAGYYSFQVTIKDAGGNFITSSVGVTVNPTRTLASIAVTPSPAAVAAGAARQLTATAYDQFGQPLANQPGFTWSVVSGGGAINSSGLYTAPGAAGSATVQASSGAISASATLTISTLSTELLWYQADAASGSTLSDSSGNGKSAALSGSYSFAFGVSGNALSLSGGYASLPAGVVSGLSDFTISTWVELGSLSSGARIFDFGTGTSVYMYLTPQASSTNLPRFAITTSGSGGEQQVNSNTAIPVGVWTHVAVTLAGNTCTLYINGVAVGNNTGMTIHPAALGNTTANYLGKSQSTDPALQGSLDDFRLFGRALSASDVLALSTPTVATLATATPATAIGTSTNLLALGADVTGGEAGLTYTWSVTSKPTGAADPTFSVNGTNAAKHTEATFTQPGNYTFLLAITNGGGRSVTSSVTVSVSIGTFSGSEADIGSPSPSGSASYNPNTNTYSVSGGGSGIGGASDQFGFLSKSVSGDATLIARVVTLQNTNSYAKAGVMFRDSTAANAKFVALVITRNWSFNFQWRSSTGGNSSTTEVGWSYQPPVWVKLVRSGNSFTAFYATTSGTPASTDWTQIGTAQTVSMNTTAQAGLAVTSNVSGTLCTGDFSGVELGQATAPTIASAASAAPNPASGTTTALSVLGADNSGGSEANLTYTWSVTGKPTGAADPAFTVNGTNAAKNTTATFSMAGNYQFTVTITNVANLSVTGTVSVTVNQMAASIAISPNGATVAPNGQKQFSVTAYDQFGTMFSPPGIVWSNSNSNLGSINAATGLFISGSLQGITAVTATLGALSSSATVNVSTLPAPVAWYRFDDGSGTVAADSSGNGLVGTLANSPTWTTGESGGGLAFNGTSQYVTVPALNLNSNTVTMSGWIKRNGTQSDYTGVVFYRNGTGTASGISLRSTGTLAYHWNDVSGTYSWSSGLTVPNGVWTFVALVITPSNATMYMQPAGSAMQSAVNAVANAAQAFSGVTCIGQDSGGSRFFNGSADDVRIYNASLSAAQIAQLDDSYFPPTVATAAAANPATVAAATSTLSALGASILGEGALKYTWSAIGTPPAPVLFSSNGTNAAKSTVATFSKAGAYTLGVTIADAYGQFTTSSVSVTVNQTLTNITVALASNNLSTTGVEQFAATACDQFNFPLISQPTFAWSVVGSGTIDSSGNYQPPYAPYPTGSAVIRATAGGATGQTTASYPGIAQWNSTGGGSWTGGSWLGTTSATAVSPPGLRAPASDYAQFATAGGTISLSGADPSLAGIFFASPSSYTLSGGAMNLGNGASPATITVSGGNHSIATPITLQSNLSVTVAANDSLTISGGVSGSGQSLTLNGPGKLVLGGSNNLNGATVLSGTLVVVAANTLPDGANLSVGANVGTVFHSAIATPAAAAPLAVPTAAPLVAPTAPRAPAGPVATSLSPRAVAAVMAAGPVCLPRSPLVIDHERQAVAASFPWYKPAVAADWALRDRDRGRINAFLVANILDQE